MSTTRWAMLGTATLICDTAPNIAGEAVSISHAACRTCRRAWSIAIRASAIRSRLPPRLASGLPNATRSVARRQASSSASSARPISRMQWCTLPGPRRAWAIANAWPGPPTIVLVGRRTSAKETSPCPPGASSKPIVESIRSTFTPGASSGTSTIECWW
jgi:hypothetical protein